MAGILKDIIDATYRPATNEKEGFIEDFGVNLNPFLRPAHFFKAASLASRGDDFDAIVHTIQANPLLPAIPTGLLDSLKASGKLPEIPEGI